MSRCVADADAGSNGDAQRHERDHALGCGDAFGNIHALGRGQRDRLARCIAQRLRPALGVPRSLGLGLKRAVVLAADGHSLRLGLGRTIALADGINLRLGLGRAIALADGVGLGPGCTFALADGLGLAVGSRRRGRLRELLRARDR